jgi:hypothetical protein
MPDFEKDPNETVAFTWDWSDDCAVQGTTVSSAVFVVPTGITKASQSNTTTKVTGLFTGGTPGRSYPVVCRPTFANGEILDFTKVIRVKEQ